MEMMTIVHRGSQLSEEENGERIGGTTYACDQAWRPKRQYHQDRKHHNSVG